MNPLVDQRLRQAYRRVQLQAVSFSLTGAGGGGEQEPPLSPIHRSTSSSLPSSSAGPGKSLDVSFKTSLVESYQRSSYTGTGTESVEGKESWEAWLSERQSASTAGAHGGVVDDILRLVSGAISSETENCLAADTGLYDSAGGLSSFGAFSAISRRHQETHTNNTADSCYATSTPPCVCTADVLALVNDVLDSHLCCHSPSEPSSPAPVAMTMMDSSQSHIHSYASRLQSLSRDVYSLADDLAWQCISGSSDILTVLAATSYCLVAQEVTISVRVINSAMFKVPTFSLQVCLQALGADAEAELAASFLHSCLPTMQEGVDYFLPGEE